jgi:hypothetical protein
MKKRKRIKQQKEKKEIDWVILFLIGLLAFIIWINHRPSQQITFEVNNDWIEKIAYEREMWGYANGLAMPSRIIGEQNYLPDLPQKSCEEIVGELYDMAQEMYPRYEPR